MPIKKIIQRMLTMCPLAWYITKRTLQLCCLLLTGACAMLLSARGGMAESYRMYMTAASLNEITQGLLLISLICSVAIEDAHT